MILTVRQICLVAIGGDVCSKTAYESRNGLNMIQDKMFLFS
jgi:hypothetical protein